MSTLHHRLVLSLACLAAACGSDQDPEPAANATEPAAQHAGLSPSLPPVAEHPEADDAPMTISSLVPDGSFAWIRLSSFDQLVELMDEFMFAFSGPGGMDFETALKHLPAKGVLENVDRTRELGLALGFSEDSTEPVVTVMLPVLDRGAVIHGLRGLPQPPQCFGIDDYVVATSLEEYRPGLGSALLTEGLPEGQLTARVDVQAVIEQVGPLLEVGLQQMAGAPGSGLGDARDSLLAGMRSAVQSAESLDFAVDLEGGEVDFSLAFVAAPDSELDGILPRSDGSLYDLARCLEDGDTVSMMFTMDSASVQERLLPFYTQTLDAAVARGELDGSVQALMVEWAALSPLFGDSIVAAVKADGNSFGATYYFQPPDREVFMSTLDSVLQSLQRDVPALRVEGPVKGSVDSAYDLSFDSDASPQTLAAFGALFPSGHLTLRIGERREVTAITVGDDEHAMSEALERIARPADQLPESLDYVMDRIGHSNPAFVARIDLVSTLRDLAARLEGPGGQELQARFGPDDEPLYLTYYGGVDGRVWRLGFRADVSHLGRLVKQ